MQMRPVCIPCIERAVDIQESIKQDGTLLHLELYKQLFPSGVRVHVEIESVFSDNKPRRRARCSLQTKDAVRHGRSRSVGLMNYGHVMGVPVLLTRYRGQVSPPCRSTTTFNVQPWLSTSRAQSRLALDPRLRTSMPKRPFAPVVQFSTVDSYATARCVFCSFS